MTSGNYSRAKQITSNIIGGVLALYGRTAMPSTFVMYNAYIYFLEFRIYLVDIYYRN